MNTNNKFIPFSLPDTTAEEADAVTNAIRSGWITTGPKAAEFELAFVDFLNSDVQAISVNSATAGLHLALEALGVGAGDEVIAPTLTFTATIEVVRYLGADPVLVDVDPSTLTIDIEGVRRAITPRTKVIMPVHYAGLPCDMDRLLELADEFGLKVVEDAAHAFPAVYKGSMIGTLRSDATVFSFYANKTMTTGEGGMVVTKSHALAKRMKVMRLHGINRDAFDRFVSKVPSWYYEVVAPGYKYNLTDVAAAMGIVQLKRLPMFHERRKHLAAIYFNELADLPILLPANSLADDQHAWHLFVIRLAGDLPIERDHVINELSRLGIGTSVHYVPLHRQPYWRDKYSLSPGMFPNADYAYQRMISIPLYTAMTDADQTRVIDSLRRVLVG